MCLDVLDREAVRFARKEEQERRAGQRSINLWHHQNQGVDTRRKNGRPLTVRLSMPVIRILADYDNLDLAKSCVGPCVDIAGCGWAAKNVRG